MASYDFSKLRVLVVDDSENMRRLILAILRGLGMRRVVEASNGEQALDILCNHDCDLVITDWVMKPVDGLSLTKEIRTGEESKDPYMPVILVTGHTDRDSIVEMRDSGVHEILAKPISAQMVYDRIVKIIEKPRPFVFNSDYAGPCRRRRKDPLYVGPERRKAASGRIVQVDAAAMQRAKTAEPAPSPDTLN
jgi:two-component system chemotaxis response regulator CheY